MAWVKSPTSVLKDIGISQPNEIDLELIAFTLDAEVIYEPLEGYEANIFGSLDKAVITVNELSIPARRRFSLSHELCHWTNDRGKNLSIECSTGDMRQREGGGKSLSMRNMREARANKFASELLMPGFMLDTDYTRAPVTFDTVQSIADTFSTSITSSAIRLIQITKYPAMIALWNYVGKRRWFDRSTSLSESIWPVQQMTNPTADFVLSNGHYVSDYKW